MTTGIKSNYLLLCTLWSQKTQLKKKLKWKSFAKIIFPCCARTKDLPDLVGGPNLQHKIEVSNNGQIPIVMEDWQKWNCEYSIKNPNPKSYNLWVWVHVEKYRHVRVIEFLYEQHEIAMLSVECCTLARKHASKGSNLTLKSSASITRSPKLGHQWPLKNDLCPPEHFLKSYLPCDFE